MSCRKQFEDLDYKEVLTPVTDHVGKFVPEMSLPIKDILNQFSYVDNIRLSEIAKQGYNIGDDNDHDFDLPEFDDLDMAERQEVYEQAKVFVSEYEAALQKQQQEQEPEQVKQEE